MQLNKIRRNTFGAAQLPLHSRIILRDCRAQFVKVIAILLIQNLLREGVANCLTEDEPEPSTNKQPQQHWHHKTTQQQQQQQAEAYTHEQHNTTGSRKASAIEPNGAQSEGCNLGNDTYQIGDKWNPDLPPHGIQVCVLCECIRQRRHSSHREGPATKVTCRRIAKDCPVIESCPYGERPAAPPGQCCKSCLSSNVLGEGPDRPSSSTQSSLSGSQNESNSSRAASNSSSAEHGSSQAAPTSKQQVGGAATTGRPNVAPKVGGPRPNNKELNTQDSKLAFRSLEQQHMHGSSSSYSSPSSSSSSSLETIKNSDGLSQAAGYSARGATETQPPQSVCKLGNTTYRLGERWSPNLPPFGIQVCVLCECIARLRKNCYEAKVTCRRIANECPVIESCPDGKEPITAPGQCCKSCQAATVAAAAAAATDSQQAASDGPQRSSTIEGSGSTMASDTVTPQSTADEGKEGQLPPLAATTLAATTTTSSSTSTTNGTTTSLTSTAAAAEYGKSKAAAAADSDERAPFKNERIKDNQPVYFKGLPLCTKRDGSSYEGTMMSKRSGASSASKKSQRKRINRRKELNGLLDSQEKKL